MENQNQDILTQEGEVAISDPGQFKQAEWVFQFDDGEPVVFAWTNDPENPGDLNINLQPNSQCNLTFRDRDEKRTFTIFAREITEPTLKMIEESGKNVVGTESSE